MEFYDFQEKDQRILDTSIIKNKILDVQYSDSHSRCKLDIYFPEKRDKIMPAIVFFHGGAFLKGDKKRYQLYSALQGVWNGYIVVSVNYRLLPEFYYLDYLLDAEQAMQYVLAHSSEYSIDANNIFVWGESAGAFLALSVALLENKYGINGVITWYAPTNLLTHPDTQVLNGKSLNYLKYRQTGKELKEILNNYSPINRITKSCPKLFIQHGLNDKVVSSIQALELAQSASRFLNEQNLVLDIVINGKHNTDVFSSRNNLKKIFEQLDKWLSQ